VIRRELTYGRWRWVDAYSAYNAHNNALNSSAVSPCSLIGLSSLSPSGATDMLESDDGDRSEGRENIVSNVDLSFLSEQMELSPSLFDGNTFENRPRQCRSVNLRVSDQLVFFFLESQNPYPEQCVFH
jgi:hypothetical protein